MLFVSSNSGDKELERDFRSCTVESLATLHSINGGSHEGYREAIVDTSCGEFKVVAYVEDQDWRHYQNLSIGETYDIYAHKSTKYPGYKLPGGGWTLQSAVLSVED